ncbi:hypothetical protein, partial [Streptomyces qinglanensis]|uniref:hypothetical protein n=1 Tax=Streptomyces qinglanensis TaxID=943816 RepID=UPI003D750835
MRKTRVAATAAGIALIAGLTACGSDKADGSGGSGADKAGGSALQGALAALKKASTATDNQNSAKVEGVNNQTVQGKSMKTEMEGVFDWSGGGMKGEADLTTGGVGNQSAKARYLPDAMYVRPASGAPGGKAWMKYDFDKLAEKGGASGAMLKDQMQNNNPARSVQLLLASGKVKALGTETVRGKKATRYSGTISVDELTRMQSKDLSEKDLDALEKQFKQQGLEKEKIDLWIDEDDLLVKKHETAKNEDGSTGIDATNYYSDYGTSVNVTAPPASETTDATEMM